MAFDALPFVRPVSSHAPEPDSNQAQTASSSAHSQSIHRDELTLNTDFGCIKKPETAHPFPEKNPFQDYDASQRRQSRIDSVKSDWSSPEIESGNNSGAITPATGTQTPNPLLSTDQRTANRKDFLQAIDAVQEVTAEGYEMGRIRSRIGTSPARASTPQPDAAEQMPQPMASQACPPELGSLWKEFVFVCVCSFGQLLFGFLLGDVTVTQTLFLEALGMNRSQAPWLIGSLLLANGLSVVLSGSLADLAKPKLMMTGAFAWLTIWNTVGAFSIRPDRKILFFIVRAMQGLSVGVLVSSCMSVLGRIYNPGIRKTRVFSGMAAAAPFGFYIGCLQGGALSYHLPWIFGSNAILCGICFIAAVYSIPPLKPAKDSTNSDAPSLRNFDWIGGSMAVLGCALFIFGLTQGSGTGWVPYTWILVIIGLAILIAFYFVEGYVARPMIPKRLWSTPGFTPLIIAYFLGFGSYVGAWQYYATQFFLNIQHASPLTTSLYITPNAIFGVLATIIVARTLHIFAGHVILTVSMIAYAMGPVFFLPQTPNTTYWALSMPGIALVTFGPDLSFAAASIFVTSQVPRSYQGSAGSLLVTTQNLSSAVFAALADTIGVRVQSSPNGEIALEGLRAIWWFSFALAILAAIICAVFVRIPKTVEKEHEH